MSDKEEVEQVEEQNTGVAVGVSQAVPDFNVEVNEGNTVSHNGETYEAGQSFTIEGPTALSLIQSGYVTIKGSV